MRNDKVETFLNRGWPALETTYRDGMELRFSYGLTKRANSVSILEYSEQNITEKIKVCEGFYSEKNLPTVFKVMSFNDAIDNVFSKDGFVKKNESIVMHLDLESFNSQSVDGVIIDSVFTDRWTENFIKTASRAEHFNGTYRKIFSRIDGEIVCASIEKEDSLVAFGYGYIKDDMVGIFDIHVDEAYRGLGFGRKIVTAILVKSKDAAKNAYLQVVDGNTVAINLYKSLGFYEIYRYWYRVKDKTIRS